MDECFLTSDCVVHLWSVTLLTSPHCLRLHLPCIHGLVLTSSPTYFFGYSLDLSDWPAAHCRSEEVCLAVLPSRTQASAAPPPWLLLTYSLPADSAAACPKYLKAAHDLQKSGSTAGSRGLSWALPSGLLAGQDLLKELPLRTLPSSAVLSWPCPWGLPCRGDLCNRKFGSYIQSHWMWTRK